MRVLLLALALLTATSHAQWTLQDAHTTADLRGIHSLGGGVAWASGSNGTVLRTEDGGYVWQLCATPPGAEKLDFRGVQGFDNNTAIVMASGKGDLSRLYKTTDGCQTWKLLVTNPDAEGFWDALIFSRYAADLVGDPVDGRFFVSSYFGPNSLKFPQDLSAPKARPGEAIFAASNSAVLVFDRLDYMIGTGGTSGARVHFVREVPYQPGSDALEPEPRAVDVPVGTKSDSSGIFSLAFRSRQSIVAVGGDYRKPADSAKTSAFTIDGGDHWHSATTQPHGFRSAVAYDAPSKTWIAVGPNGTDISTDDGRNWRALKPTASEPADADQHWNALSLPFVVGPHGRIGLFNPDTLRPTTK